MWTPTPSPAWPDLVAPEAALALEVLEHGAGLFLLDPEFRIAFVNEEFERSSGTWRRDVLGSVFWDVFPEAARPDGHFWREYHRAMRERVTLRFEDFYPPTGLWTDVSVHPLRNGWLAVFFRDVTAQKRAEAALREQHAFSSAVLDTVANLVVVLDPEARIVGFNKACERATGYEASQVIGRPVFELLIPEEEIPGARATFDRLRMGDFPNTHRNRWRARDGSHRLIAWTNTAIPGEGGRARFVIATGIDVTDREQALEALAETNTRFRVLFDTMAEGFALIEVLLDARGRATDLRYVDVNPAFERLTGLAAAEVLGRTARELFPGAQPGALERLGEVARTGAAAHFEASFAPLHRWFEVTAHRTGPGRVAVAFLDATERKRREAHQALHAGVADDFARLGTEDEITGAIGARLAAHLGISSCSVADLVGGFATVRSAFTRPGALAPGTSTLRVAEVLDDELQALARAGRTIVIRDTRADGRVDAARHEALGVRAAIVVPFLSGGAWRHSFAVATPEPRDWRDDEVQLVEEVASRFFPRIARARAEEALRRSELRLRRLVEAIPIGVVEGDAGGMIVNANDAYLRIIGHSRAELEAGAVRWDALTPPEHRARDAEAVTEARQRGVSSVYEKEYLLRTGARVPVLVACATFGGPEALIAFVVDITDRKRAEEALRESDRRKTEFLAVLSHELRNPLAPIRNAVRLLERAPPGSDAAQRAVEIVRRQADHLTRLVDDLLDMSRITHGKFELQLARVDAREVVRRACEDARALFDGRGVGLSLAQDADPLWVDADAARLSQIVGNLLSNALKFSPEGGEVRVGVERRGEACEISVLDRGVGIDPADLERIFEPFVQSQRSGAGHGGMGIGLALVRDLTSRMAGAVRAGSAGPGTGAQFVVELPLVPPPPRAAAEPAREARPASLSVLVVEDNEDAAATLADLLALGGHRVATAATGREGVDAAASGRPDVLICDVGLPDMSGHDVIREIRARGGEPTPFAIALTGYAQPHDRQAALSAGFDAHLAKPPPLEALEALLGEAARRRRAPAT